MITAAFALENFGKRRSRNNETPLIRRMLSSGY
jgi:hypothetical protein